MGVLAEKFADEVKKFMFSDNVTTCNHTRFESAGNFFDNFQLSIKHYGASKDSSPFSFGGFSAEIVDEKPKNQDFLFLNHSEDPENGSIGFFSIRWVKIKRSIENFASQGSFPIFSWQFFDAKDCQNRHDCHSLEISCNLTGF